MSLSTWYWIWWIWFERDINLRGVRNWLLIIPAECSTLGLCYIDFLIPKFSSGFAIVQMKVDDCDGLMRSCECPGVDFGQFCHWDGSSMRFFRQIVRHFLLLQKVSNMCSKSCQKIWQRPEYAVMKTVLFILCSWGLAVKTRTSWHALVWSG